MKRRMLIRLMLLVFVAASCAKPPLGDRYVADVITTTLLNGEVASTITVRWNTTVDDACLPKEKIPVNSLSTFYVEAKPSISPGDRLEFVVTFDAIELPTQDGQTPCFRGYFNEEYSTVVSG